MLPPATAQASLSPVANPQAYPTLAATLPPWPWSAPRSGVVTGQAIDDRHVLAACTRFHSFTGIPEFPPEHCFLKLLDRDSLQTIDSLSFSYNQAPASPDAKPDHPTNRCQFVDYIDRGTWQRLRDYYQTHGAPETFSKTTNNCCTCAKNAITTTLGVTIPKNILLANGGGRNLSHGPFTTN